LFYFSLGEEEVLEGKLFKYDNRHKGVATIELYNARETNKEKKEWSAK
jgi:transposase